MFHAVSLVNGVVAAKALAFSYPRIADGIYLKEQASALLTAVVEDELDRKDDEIRFAVATLEQSGITVVAAAEVAGLAQIARRELKL